MDGAQTTRQPPQSMADIEAIFQVAAKGDPEALRQTAALTAIGVGQPKDWEKAVQLLAAAARAGSAQAGEELALLGADPAGAVNKPAVQALRTQPVVARAPGIASPALCDWLAQRAAPLLEQARVYEMPKEMIDESGQRSNTGAALRLLGFGLPLIALRERMAKLIGLPVEGFETTNVLHYDVGETFSPHYDTFQPEQMQTDPDARQFGHRLFTVLVYLNTEFEGGETDFPLIGFRHRGGKGDALVWRNVTQSVEIDRDTLHAGLTPTAGEKWVLSQWIRGKRMPLAL
jgi:hypothetical protein